MEIILAAVPFFFLLIGLEIAYNRWKKKNYYNANDSMSNIGTGILSELGSLLIKPLLLLLYAFVFNNWNLDQKLGLNWFNASGIMTWVVGFFLVDFIYYWFHRHSHEINLLWSAHIVHHSSEEYNLSVALRQSTFQGLFSIVYFLVLAFVGIPPVVFISSYAINLIHQFWIHTRFVPKLGFLESILITPSHHRVHHSRQIKYLDKNYAGFFILWDKLFKTFKEEEEAPVYGVYPRFRSYNPVEANWAPFRDLFHYFALAPSLKEKFFVLFKGPLWLFENYKKKDFKPIKTVGNHVTRKEAYIIFLMCLIVALVALNTVKFLDWRFILVMSLASALGLYFLGILLDSKPKS